MQTRKDFGFGLEAEYLLVDHRDLRPLWHRDLRFVELRRILDSIPLSGLPSICGLYANPPERAGNPYSVEGYHLHDASGQAVDLLPKGVEIRTPKTSRLDDSLAWLEVLHRRLQSTLVENGLRAVALSHHPVEDRFEGPQGPRTEAYWPWGMQAMTTYGPDYNVSLPDELQVRLNLEALARKVNYYTPALTALTLASPFSRGGLWRTGRGSQIGRSIRTFRRSQVGEALELHPDQEWRLEFKPLEMPRHMGDFRNGFLFWLELLLDPGLKGEHGAEERRADLREVAQNGLEDPRIRARAQEVIDGAQRTLPGWGFDVDSLALAQRRLDNQVTPADEMIELYLASGSMAKVLHRASFLVAEEGEESGSERLCFEEDAVRSEGLYSVAPAASARTAIGAARADEFLS